jgi:hypothetical protein
VPPFAGPRIRYLPASHRLELVVGDECPALSVADILVIRG